jgi:phytoene dehydrogenase-like protein
MADAEVIIVGGGHNGLICGAYLARAGLDTMILESRSTVGGCASTVSDLGARFNICHCEHTMVRAMPVIEELELADHDLHYLESEAASVYAFHDGAEPWAFFHDVDRTIDSLAATYPRQVAGYRRYLSDATPVAELALEMARTPPSLRRFTATAAGRRGKGVARLMDWSRRSVNDVFAEYFDDWRVTMPSICSAPTIWGISPDARGTGLAATNYASRHLMRSGRPRGGSGALTDAVRASFEAAGGRVRCDSTVEMLVLRAGVVEGVRLVDGTALTASAVVAACDPHRVFVDWIDDPPSGARRLMDRWRDRPVQEGYESKIDAVLTGLPRLQGTDRLEDRHPGLDVLCPSIIVAPSPDELASAHRRRREGLVADRPTMLVNLPSVLDSEMRPAPGHHVLSIEVLYTPYSLPGGWPDSSEPERWLGLWSELMEPGALDLVEAWRSMTPDKYEAEFLMHRGHTPSFGASPLAALVGRPRELTRYRTPIAGLYLSGAGTFPGAGIFGAAGRNAADVVARDLRGPIGRRLSSLRRQRPRLGRRREVVA